MVDKLYAKGLLDIMRNICISNSHVEVVSMLAKTK